MNAETVFLVVLLALVLGTIGAIGAFFPHALWRATARLESRNADGPSDWYLSATRFSGICALVAIPVLVTYAWFAG